LLALPATKSCRVSRFSVPFHHSLVDLFATIAGKGLADKIAVREETGRDHGTGHKFFTLPSLWPVMNARQSDHQWTKILPYAQQNIQEQYGVHARNGSLRGTTDITSY
jgi:hypothetical protein